MRIETLGSQAVRWFNWQYSLPRVILPSLWALIGRRHIGAPERPLAMTYSIAEDYARLWLHFARQSLDTKTWDFLVVDSAGEMDVSKLVGSTVLRFLNVAHGIKIDLFLRHILRSERVFLCDDDMYLLRDITPLLAHFDDPQTPIVSLFPRNWWTFQIEGREFVPMGSFALLMNRQFLVQQQLKFQSPKGRPAPYKKIVPGFKPREGYDTGDYVNEQLLLAGYNVVITPDQSVVLGFKGLSDKRKVLIKFGKAPLKQALSTAAHYKKGTVSGEYVRSIYSIVKVEHLYRRIFHEEPKVVSGFAETELRELVTRNGQIDAAQKQDVHQGFDAIDTIYTTLLGYV